MSNVQVRRSEFIREKLETSAFGVVEKPLTAWERIYNQSAARKAAILVVLAAIWEVYASVLDNPLLFSHFQRDTGSIRECAGDRRATRAHLVLAQGAADGLRRRVVARRGPHRHRD